MDFLKAEVANKRKAVESETALRPKKYLRRGEVEKLKEEEERKATEEKEKQAAEEKRKVSICTTSVRKTLNYSGDRQHLFPAVQRPARLCHQGLLHQHRSLKQASTSPAKKQYYVYEARANPFAYLARQIKTAGYVSELWSLSKKRARKDMVARMISKRRSKMYSNAKTSPDNKIANQRAKRKMM